MACAPSTCHRCESPMATQQIECKLITIPRGYPERQPFSKLFAELLACSIEHYGLLQPIIVRPGRGKSGRFLLVAGRYRLHAVASVLRERYIEAKVVEGVSQLEAETMFFLENHERCPLTTNQSIEIGDGLGGPMALRVLNDIMPRTKLADGSRPRSASRVRRAITLMGGLTSGQLMELVNMNVSLADAVKIARIKDDERRNGVAYTVCTGEMTASDAIERAMRRVKR